MICLRRAHRALQRQLDAERDRVDRIVEALDDLSIGDLDPRSCLLRILKIVDGRA